MPLSQRELAMTTEPLHLASEEQAANGDVMNMFTIQKINPIPTLTLPLKGRETDGNMTPACPLLKGHI